MSDPFRPEANKQLMREARIGLTLLVITMGTFVYVAYYRISGNGLRLPEHVVNAPIAESVWPGEKPLSLAEKKQAPPTLGSQFGSLLASARDQFGIDEEKSPAGNLRRQSGDYKDPTPRKDNSPMPGIKLPDRETLEERPNDIDDLRTTRAIAASASEIESDVIKKADRLPKKQASTEPVIVTPDKVNVTDFAAATLRPLCESANSQLTRSKDFAPTGNSTNQLRTQNPEPDQREQPQFADDNSFSHEGARISSQVVTSDIAANLSEKAFEPVAAQRQAAIQTSFDGEMRQPPELAVDPITKPALVKLSMGTPSASTADNDRKIENQHEHLVLAGESFWLIAQEHYDDGRFFRALYEYNKQRIGSFENLLPGSTLATPPKTELIKLWPELCPGLDDSSSVSTNIRERIYVTQQGDTLFEIARQRLEQASRYLDIQKLNQFRLPDSVNHLSPLPAGIQLVLPLDDSQ